MKYPVAVGLDGYYYCLQVRQLVEHHHLYFPSHSPIIFYLMAGISKLCGDTTLAIKSTAIALDLLLALGSFLLVAAVTDSLWMGALASTLVPFSALHFYFLSEFIKNLGGMVLLVWSGFWLVAGFKWRRKLCFLLAVIFSGGAVLTHPSALILIPSLGGCLVAVRFLADPQSSRRVKSIVVLLLLLAWLSPAVLSWQTVHLLPEQYRLEFVSQPEFPIRQLGWADKTILLAVVPFVCAFLIVFRRELRKSPLFYVAGVTALWSLLITLNPFFNRGLGSGGVSGRLSDLAYLQVAILVPCFVKLGLLGRTKWPAVFVLALSPLVLVATNGSLPQGLEPEYLEGRVDLVKGLVSTSQMIERSSLVLAPHGDEFLVTYLTGVESRHEWSDADDSDRTLWLLRAVKANSLTPSMVILSNTRKGAITLISDGKLRSELSLLPLPARASLTSTNLHLYAAIHGIRVPRSLGDSW